MYAGFDSGFVRGGKDPLDGVEHRRLLVIELRLVAQRQAEVTGPDVNAAQMRGAHDIGDVLQRARGFYHRQDHDRIVGVAVIVAAVGNRCAGRTEAARADRCIV